MADGNLWIGCNDEIFYNDFDTAITDAWTSKTSNVVAGHVITAVGGVDDWILYATADSNSQALYAAHTSKNGESKVKRDCTLPVTGYGEVDLLVTEFAVFVFEGGKMILKEIAPDITMEELLGITEGEFTVDPDLKIMEA